MTPNVTGHPALRSMEYWALRYKRTWRGSIVGTFLTPVGYLVALGYGIGPAVGVPGLGAQAQVHLTYASYLGPGLLAAATVQAAAGEATWPVMDARRWMRTYHSMLHAPMETSDILSGHIGWICVRLATVATGFFAVMAALGLVRSPWGLAAPLVAVVTGVGFATMVASYAIVAESQNSIAVVFRVVVLPMFLASGVFFPLATMPRYIQAIVYAAPLAHGVALCRALTLGTITTMPVSEVVGHVVYLVGFCVLAYLVARRQYARALAG